MYKFSSICAVVAALVTFTASQSALAQGNCGEIEFTANVTDQFPQAADACLGIVRRDGRPYARFEAEITRVRGREVRVRFQLPNGEYTQPYAFEAEPGQRVQIQGRSYRYGELQPGQELHVYLPADRWEIRIPEVEDFATAQVVVQVIPYRAPPDNTVAALPRTASLLPLVGVLGVFSAALAVGIAVLGRRRVKGETV